MVDLSMPESECSPPLWLCLIMCTQETGGDTLMPAKYWFWAEWVNAVSMIDKSARPQHKSRDLCEIRESPSELPIILSRRVPPESHCVYSRSSPFCPTVLSLRKPISRAEWEIYARTIKDAELSCVPDVTRSRTVRQGFTKKKKGIRTQVNNASPFAFSSFAFCPFPPHDSKAPAVTHGCVNW